MDLSKLTRAHRLYQNIQLRTFLQGRQGSGKFSFAAVEAGQQLAVGVDLCPVVHFGDFQVVPEVTASGMWYDTGLFPTLG